MIDVDRYITDDAAHVPVVMPEITLGAAAARHDVSYTQLHHWVALGYLEVPRRGRGHQRHLNEREQSVLAHMLRLIGVGFGVPQAADLARALTYAPGTSLRLPGGVCITLTNTSDTNTSDTNTSQEAAA